METTIFVTYNKLELLDPDVYRIVVDFQRLHAHVHPGPDAAQELPDNNNNNNRHFLQVPNLHMNSI